MSCQSINQCPSGMMCQYGQCMMSQYGSGSNMYNPSGSNNGMGYGGSSSSCTYSFSLCHNFVRRLYFYLKKNEIPFEIITTYLHHMSTLASSICNGQYCPGPCQNGICMSASSGYGGGKVPSYNSLPSMYGNTMNNGILLSKKLFLLKNNIYLNKQQFID